MSSQRGLIAVDWGTSAFRAYLVAADGRVMDRVETTDGILTAASRGFAEVLTAAVAQWQRGHGVRLVLLSGMIGSRQGWSEAPYLECPADATAIASALHKLDVPDLGDVRIVPGLSTQDQHGVPDVMRGEETQILGAIRAIGRPSGVFVLPGTHSKWVSVEDGHILDFTTYMTGEVYAALKGHTILGRLMTGDQPDSAGFARGVAAARQMRDAPGSLLHAIFSARTLALFDRLAPHHVASYLSGLLIGEELLAAAPQGRDVTIVAAPELAALYAAAAAELEIEARSAPADCVAIGHHAIATHLWENDDRA